MDILIYPSLPSTNSYIKEHASEVPARTMLLALEQTAGRGQRGNSWEAQPGKNLTLSFHFQPVGLPAAEQFLISEAVALAVVDTLGNLGVKAAVKWPNDIYVGPGKICGILIENSLMSREITRCIVGIGLNVNQTEFISDAPNPVSLAGLTGHTYELREIACQLGNRLECRLSLLNTSEGKRDLHARYKESLIWKPGFEYTFKDCACGETFDACFSDIEPSGHLLLAVKGENSPRRYAFKEVAFITTSLPPC